MITIRTRLLAYFTVVVVFTIIIFIVQNQSNERIFNLYDDSLDQFFQLNEISQKTADTYESLHIYVLDPLPENLETFNQNREELAILKQSLNDMNRYEEDATLINSYQNMITSFQEQTADTIDGVYENQVQVYSYHLNEAENISQYIHETTLELIDNSLTSYYHVSPMIDQQVEYTKKVATTVLTSLLLLGILIALWFSSGATKTIRKLTESAEEISAGRFTGNDVEVSTKDELWFLTKTFNEMKTNINTSVKEIEEKSRLTELLKETELRSLQNQINPHFLFNTLNTISQTAYIEGADKTSELITSVSTLLRYNLGNLENPTVLADEVKIVSEYFFIQTTRFRGRVTFQENIDYDCLQTPIPSLTLQPIVENAFMHGIEDMPSGAKIELSVYKKQGFVFIEVKDNGVGMNQETIDRLLLSEEEESGKGQTRMIKHSGHSTGIGLKNVISRLHLFDNESEVKVDSELGKGTTITIKLAKVL
ncbi:sensor histidine kinase [Salipaludibacillus sp. HK11]|uniref:sensor histidine kinase n=1 Tax=Salipaludibacillus sp. HK11 TaxID=3394320 RepID=UPI0039FCDA87